MANLRLILLSCLPWYTSAFQLFIYGLGNVGRAVAEEASKDWIVRGTRRVVLESDGGIAVPIATAADYLSESSHVLITIPPNPELSILKDLSEQLKPSSWVGFVSTTGVYGNHDGAWVTEESPLLCNEGSSAFAYVEFERKLMELAEECNWNASIYRCSGLYGSTRSALHTLWKRGPATTNKKKLPPAATTIPPSITNRIHESDVARAIVSAMEKQCSGIYNLGDDEPESRSIVMDYAATLLASNDLTPPDQKALTPPSKKSPPSKRTLRRTAERKLVKNDKMKSELIDHLSYPTYREGLHSILQDQSNQWWTST